MDQLDPAALASITRQFPRDATLRWSFRRGDFLIWFRCQDLFTSSNGNIRPLDMWEMRDGDYVTITNRGDDLPTWFELNGEEVTERFLRGSSRATAVEVMDGPNIWRAQTGDRLVWVGEARWDLTPVAGMLSILECDECALALGETTRETTMWDIFGSISQDGLSDADIARCHVAVKAMAALGYPRSISTEWLFG